MAAGKWQLYDQAKLNIGGAVDLTAASHFRVCLVDSTYVPALTHSTWNDVVAKELPTANGYTANGFGITQSWTNVSGVETFDSDDPTWTATTGSIAARYAVLVHDANGDGTLATSDKLIAYCLLDATPADVIATAGNAFVIQIDVAGYFTLSGGTGA